MTAAITPAGFAGMGVKRKGTQRVKGAKRTTRHGITFDSKREADRYTILLDRQRKGEITNLRRQVVIPLVGACGPIMTDSGKSQRVYKADFAYIEAATGLQIYEDAKGYATEVYKFKKAVLSAQGVEIVEV